MSLPYENTTSGEKAINEMQKVLQKFGCSKFGQMMDWDTGELLIQFQYRSMPVSVKASVNGYAAVWLKEHPWSSRSRTSKIDHERKAPHLTDLIERLQVCELLLRLSKDKRLISTGQYANAIKLTDSVGKQAGGWRRSALSPAK